MQNENKYVPPALRSQAGSFEPQGYDNRYANQGSHGYGGNSYGYQRTDYGEQQQQSYGNSRWKNDGGNYNSGGGYGGYEGGGGRSGGGYSSNYQGNRQQYGGQQWNNARGGSYGGGGGGGGGRGYQARTNELGFHGDMRANPRIEQELFHSGEGQVTGINFDKYDDIPVEVSEGCPEPYLEFTIETIGAQLHKNLALMKFTRPTPVQKYSIPIGLGGGDMMACAQTGSGKTAGFLFPVIATMLRSGAAPEPEGYKGRGSFITALILAPTRELAMQIWEEANKFCYCTGIRPVVVYGGANIQQQQKELDTGADILVATPGRLVDLIERGRIRLDCVKFLVLDEADRMLDMGFEPQIRRIVQEEGMSVERQTFMFSATFPVEIQRLAGDFMKDYIFLAVGRVGAASKDVTQRIEWVEQHEKTDFVLDFLGRVSEGLVLVFVETKRGADSLEETLMRNNFPASSIHGDKSQREREDALKMFKTGRTPILVATDVAARGLDIPNVTQVINMDLPSNIDDYVHRIGRTGRVGNVGNALSLMNDKNRNIAKELIELLVESEQELPAWLERMGTSFGYNARGGGRGRGRGGGRFGARDYRREGGSNAGAGGFSSGRGGGGRGGGRGGHAQAGGYQNSAPQAYGGGHHAAPVASHQYAGGSAQGYAFNDNTAW